MNDIVTQNAISKHFLGIMPVTDWHNVSLLGIDVGFSKTARSTGIAVYAQGRLTTLTCVGSQPRDRAEALPADLACDAIAIDGPIVADIDRPLARHCELILSRGAFSRRCKPGLSHFGFGLPLREAATRIAGEMRSRAKPGTRAIVEAFPNAFLGVLLGEDDYAAMGAIERGKKSDAYYVRAAATERFEIVLAQLGWNDDVLLKILHDNAAGTGRASHDRRAALVCLLTAACAYSKTAEYVGDEAGGWICLPPKALWTPWAREALSLRPTKSAKRLAGSRGT